MDNDFKDYLQLSKLDLFILYKNYYSLFNYDFYIYATDSFILNHIDDFNLRNTKFLMSNFFIKKSKFLV
jgi:hypothetical protein